MFPFALGWADPVPSLDPAGLSSCDRSRANLYLEPTATPGHLKWNVAAWASYARRLVTVTDATGKEVAVPVENQLSMDYALVWVSVSVGLRRFAADRDL